MIKSPLHQIVETSPNLSPSTRERYIRDLDRWIEFAGSDASKWSPHLAQTYYQKLLDGDAKAKGITPQSANRTIAAIRYASRWWAKTEKNPALDFALIRVDGRAPDTKSFKPLSESEATLLLVKTMASFRKDRELIALRDFALEVVGLETGMRRMSLRSLRLIDLDVEPGYPVARVLLKGEVKRFPVPLSDTAKAALDAWIHVASLKSGPVFCTLERGKSTGRPLSEGAIHKLVAKRASDAGIQSAKRHVHPHLFRHTFLSWRTAAGLSPEQRAAITGHHVNLGAMTGYISQEELGRVARNSTPSWLADLVRDLIKGIV